MEPNRKTMQIQYHNFTLCFLQELLHLPQDGQQWANTDEVMVYPEPA
jgi:hypothetical protein